MGRSLPDIFRTATEITRDYHRLNRHSHTSTLGISIISNSILFQPYLNTIKGDLAHI